MQELAPTQSTTQAPGAPTQPSALPPFARPSSGVNPMHSRTESTIAPTAEFTRIFLLGWIVRYIFRGGSGLLFGKPVAIAETSSWFEKARAAIINAAGFGGRFLQRRLFPNIPVEELGAAAYSTSVGIGSGLLTLRYSQMVKNDIINMFSEAVGYEFGKSPDTVTFDDIAKSKNAIVQITVKNYHEKTGQRLIGDGLFLAAAPLRHAELTDVLLGVKGIQMFAETWKRKSTMFEDIVNLVNNKINPRNGLGQPVTVGEVFDLYQHYCEQFAPNRMFTNVVEKGTNQDALWANSQTIFQRIAELMNLTYAYKHQTILDAQGQPVTQANFPLPKLIYLLGHDMIDTRKPEQTLALIEIANRYDMEILKEASTALASGTTLAAITERYPIAQKANTQSGPAPISETPNAITKGNHPDIALDTPSTITQKRELALPLAMQAAHLVS